MRRWMGLGVIIAVVLVLAGSPALAQDTARERIRAAYQAYEEWDTYQVTVTDSSDFAMTAEGEKTAIWEKRERDVTLSGWYDVTDRANSLIAINVSSKSAASMDDNGEVMPQRWAINLDAALVNGELFWRGSYSASPTGSFALPAQWETFSAREADAVPGLADLLLGRYLLQGDEDPFVGDYNAWLDAAISIEGPESFRVDKSTAGDLYTIEVALADAPELLQDRFLTLTAGEETLVSDRAVLLDSLGDNSTFLWGVVLDPASGQLMAQYIQLDLSAALDSASLAAPYSTLSLEFSHEQSARFSAVNQTLEFPELP